MRLLALLLCAATPAWADLAAEKRTDDWQLPASDGRRIVYQLEAHGERIELDMVDTLTQRREHRSLNAAQARRLLRDFQPMRKVELLRRSGEKDLTRGAGFQYDRQSGRLTLAGAIGRSVDVCLRDTCWGEPRTQLPDDLTIYLGDSVALLEAAAHGGSCMCDDPATVLVVDHATSFRLADSL